MVNFNFVTFWSWIRRETMSLIDFSIKVFPGKFCLVEMFCCWSNLNDWLKFKNLTAGRASSQSRRWRDNCLLKFWQTSTKITCLVKYVWEGDNASEWITNEFLKMSSMTAQQTGKHYVQLTFKASFYISRCKTRRKYWLTGDNSASKITKDLTI